jgi:nucleoside-diphosphate-sugar epimerase
MRVLFVGGTGPVGLASLPHLLAARHEVALAHSGVHEPDEARDLEHLHGERRQLLARGGPAERWRPEVIVDTFAGGATAAKGSQLVALGERAGVARIVAVSSMDVYRHCADAGVDGNEPAQLPRDPLPLTEDHDRRAHPSPGSGVGHDNVAVEDALRKAGRVTVLRPGAIYGPYDHPYVLREWYLVRKVAEGVRLLAVPDGGTQIFNRVAVDRVGRAVAAAIEQQHDGFWACNVADASDFTFGGLARLVADRLDWEWTLELVPWEEGDHPWNVRHPVIADTTRLRDTLGVVEPDSVQATLEQIDWLWANRQVLASRES